MKKTITAAFVLSLLAGTSAYAQTHHRGDGDGDWRGDRHQSDDDRQDRHSDDRPARPVPQVSNPRAQAAIAEARSRQEERAAAVDDRRSGRPEEAVAPALRAQVERHSQPETATAVPRVAPRTEERRTDDRRSGDDSQHVYIGAHNRDGDRTDHYRDGDRADHHRDGDRSRYERYRRPGDGHELRDRDRNRHWYNPDQWRRSYRATHRYRIPYHRPSGWYVRTWVFGDYLPHGWYAQSSYLDWWRYSLPMPPIGTEWVRVGDDALLVDTWSGEVLSVYQDLFW